jgi:type I restriction-modification system DNA methylase subunit
VKRAAHESNEHRAYDQALFWMIERARADALERSQELAMAVVALKYLVERRLSAGMTGAIPVVALRPWPDMRTQQNARHDLLMLAREIDRSFDDAAEVFGGVLLRDIDHLSAPTLRAWIEILSAMSLWNAQTEGAPFVEWLNAQLDEGPSGRPSPEYNTPGSIARLMVSLANVSPGDRVLDPFAGLGGLLVEAVRQSHRSRHNIQVYGQERISSAWAWTVLRLRLFECPNARLENSPALTAPAFRDEGKLPRFDVVLCDGPWGTTPHEVSSHSTVDAERFVYTQGGRVSTDAAVVQHVAASLTEGGRGILLRPHGFLFRSGLEQQVRRWLVESGLLRGVIGLPAKMLFQTSLQTSVLVLHRSSRAPADVVFIDASGIASTRRGRVELDAAAIGSIHAAIYGPAETPAASLSIGRRSAAEIAAQEYSLQPRRYVDEAIRGDRFSPDDSLATLASMETSYRSACDEIDIMMRRLR